ncbi:MAG TPA: hypothetical protein VF984_05020 [Actinomycetota bacterium]
MRKIVRTLAVLSVGAITIVPMWPAQAAVERHELQCTTYLVSFDGSGGRGWEAGNTSHGRTGVETNRTEGSPYCAGMEIVGPEAGFNQGLVFTAWGTFRYELDAYPGSGFEGGWQLQFNNANQGQGEEVGTGYGFFEGWQIRTSFQLLDQEEETDPYYLVWGYVFNPAG